MHIFVIIFLIIFSLANIYIFFRLWKTIPRHLIIRVVFIFLYIVIAGGYILGHLTRGIFPPGITSALTWLGSWWIGFIFYYILLLFLIDLFFLCNRIVHYLPSRFSERPDQLRKRLVIGGMGAVLILILAGHLNARTIRTREIDLDIGRSCGPLQEVKIAYLSDLHLGNTVGSKHLKKILNILESARPDLILLGGDIVDADIAQIEKTEFSELLSRFHAPLGVYAVTGNHEYIAGIERSVAFLNRSGISLLRDRCLKIAESFYLVGRDDLAGARRGRPRKDLDRLLQGVDLRCPVILLDHQPARLEEEAASGADLILCGHTHHGQLFPINLITRAIYGYSWGLFKREGTSIYISSGVGTWGPPVRIGNVPEIAIIKLTFSGSHRSRSRGHF